MRLSPKRTTRKKHDRIWEVEGKKAKRKGGSGQEMTAIAEPEEEILSTRTQKPQRLVISPPNYKTAVFRIIGTKPLVMHRFSAKVQKEMEEKQMKGGPATKERKRKPKDFKLEYKESMHISKEGWHGIPVTAFRNAMVSACRLVSFKMTIAKLAVEVEGDGYDIEENTPLVKIIKGKPFMHKGPVRNANGQPDIRARAMWNPGWEADVRVRYDADQFTLEDVANLMMRVGLQVGILEGRNDGKNGCGMGWGGFILSDKKGGLGAKNK
jgi:hypothetical protein